MIIEIKNKINFKKSNPFELQKTEEIKKNISKTWENFIKENKNYFDGDIIVVKNIDIEKNTLEIGKDKYSSLIYAKQYKDLVVRSLFVAVLMKSTDNKYLVIKNIYDKTNIIGGVADIQDFDEESFIPEKCLEREIKEELGISLKNPKDIKKYDSKYLRIPGKNENYYTCGILYTAELNYTSEQFKKYFYKTKEKLDNEIKEIYFYTKDEVLNLNLDDIDIKYLRDFIKAENPD